MNLRIYCEFEVLDWVLLYEDEVEAAKILRKLLEDHADIIIDKEDEEILRLESANTFLKSLRKREGKELISIPNFLDQISKDTIHNYNKDIIIISEKDKADLFRINYGLLATDSENFNELNPYFRELFRTRIQAGNLYEFDGIKGWKGIFNKLPQLTCNCVCIIDNHIFKTETEYKFIDENLFEILDWIFPSTIKVPIHLTFVHKVSDFLKKKIDELKFQSHQVIDRIEEYLKDRGFENYKIELIVHDLTAKDIHARTLITNHYSIYSDVGFNLFSNGKAIKTSNPLRIEGNFSQINREFGDCQYQMIWDELSNAKRIYMTFKSNKLETGHEKQFICAACIENPIFD